MKVGKALILSLLMLALLGINLAQAETEPPITPAVPNSGKLAVFEIFTRFQ